MVNMPYSLEQIYGALAASEHGADMVNDLQTEIGHLRKESGNYRAANKNILEQLGIDDASKAPETLAGIMATIKELKASGQAPDTVGTQLSALSKQVKDLTDKYTASEEKATTERNKRIQTAIQSQLTTALTDGKAIKPEVFSQLLMGNVKADDDSLVFKSGDKEVSVADGVKNWLQENAWAVKNDSTPGAGSGAPAGTVGKTYSMDDLSKMSREEINEHWDDISKGVTK